MTAVTWVPVADRLPTNDRTVLVVAPCDEGTVWTGWFATAEGVWYDSTGWRGITVTHWAELPKGPTS
jgi:hypothetical protein